MPDRDLKYVVDQDQVTAIEKRRSLRRISKDQARLTNHAMQEVLALVDRFHKDRKSNEEFDTEACLQLIGDERERIGRKITKVLTEGVPESQPSSAGGFLIRKEIEPKSREEAYVLPGSIFKQKPSEKPAPKLEEPKPEQMSKQSSKPSFLAQNRDYNQVSKVQILSKKASPLRRALHETSSRQLI
jgi:hypothetical protein